MDPFTTETFALLGIGLTVIALRTCARIHDKGLKGLKSDDYLMWLAAFAYNMETMIAYMINHYWGGLSNSFMTDEERRMLSPSDPEYRIRVNGSKTHIMGWCSYILLLWATKGSMCAFYLRLTERLESLESRVHFGFYLLVVTYAAVTLNILFACGLPFKKNWQIYPEPANSCQTTVSLVKYIVTLTLNIVTDVYLMAIPVPMLLNARLKTSKKLGLCLLFSGGIFVGTAAILGVVIGLKPKKGRWMRKSTFHVTTTGGVCEFTHTTTMTSSTGTQDRGKEGHDMAVGTGALRVATEPGLGGRCHLMR